MHDAGLHVLSAGLFEYENSQQTQHYVPESPFSWLWPHIFLLF